MKSIQTKILCLIFSCVLISTIAVVMVSITNYGGILDENSEEIMSLQCTEKRQEIDEQLRSIEQSVNTIYHFSVAQFEQMGMEKKWQDEKSLEKYINKVRDVAENAVENTTGAIAVYYRFNPEVTNPTEGLFLSRDSSGRFVDFEMTDILKYDRNDVEHVGWYYIPLENGKATWMSPYYNKNMDIYMISYVIPVYVEDTTIGIIGMDIELDELYKNVDSVAVYDSGYAFLMDETGNILYHKDYQKGLLKEQFTEEQLEVYEKNLEAEEKGKAVSYTRDGVQKRLVAQKLRNGMLFSVCVPEKEIVEPQQRMIAYSLGLAGVILVVAILITIQVTRVMIRPLKQLTEAARKIANADLEVDIECKSKDEVGILAQSFQQTAEHLRHYIDYINRLAYTDVLTNLKNKTAYEECVAHLEKRITEENAKFAVVVMDINNLKKTNDSYGHEKGDMLIQNAASVMKKVWGTEHTYRIGGDEFVSIFIGEGRFFYQSRIALFEEEITKFNRENNSQELFLQVAVGMAEFEEERDCVYADVFRRADTLMYEDKARKKQAAL